jgi:hypothetical protein
MTRQTVPDAKPRTLTVTVDDITQTRYGSTGTRMHWPVDPETTARLKRIIKLDTTTPLTRTRRLLRWLKRIR